MRARGVGTLQKDGSRKINKMGNDDLARDVDEERGAFDSAVIAAIRTAIPEFNTQSLSSFYQELMMITGENDRMVRRGVSSSLGKIVAEDLLLSGALSQNSPFFTQRTVGKAIRQKGLEKYGIIEIREELDVMTESPVVVNYPEGSDPEFANLTNDHLPNYHLSTLSPQASNLGLNPKPYSQPPSNSCRFQLLCGISAALGAVALIIAFGVLNVATAGTAAGITLAVLGGIAFFGGGVGLAVAR